MKKPEIVSYVAEGSGITKKAARQVLKSFVQAVQSSLKNRRGRIRVAGLGTFRVVEMASRRGVNPRTGKKMTIPAMRLPRFTPARALKETILGKR